MFKSSIIQRISTYPYFGCVKCSARLMMGDPHHHQDQPVKWLQTPVLSRAFTTNFSPSQNNNVVLPPLMQGEAISVPNILNTLRNWFFALCIIRPYMDNEFSIFKFGHGAKQALSVISKKLASGEFQDLEGLVDPSALSEVQNNIAKFSVSQRELLAVDMDDIAICYPYEIGVIIPDRQQITSADGKTPQIRHVEIMVVFHVIRGKDQMEKEIANMSIRGFSQNSDMQKRVMVCNYRFFRDFTEGREQPWIVNYLNHFSAADLPKNQ